MTSPNTDILGERTALERMIYDLQYAVDTRKDDGCSGSDSLGPIGLSIEYAGECIKHLESILAKYRMLEKAAEQYKNQTEVSEKDYSRMDASVRMILSARDLMLNVIHLAPHDNAILKAARLILDLAVEELDRND